jgi:hypothetical protein
MVTIDADDYDDALVHYGTPRKSGRYPYGSGGNIVEVPTRNRDFLEMVKSLRAQGLTDTQIAQGMGMSTTDFRAKNSIAKNQHRQEQISEAWRLKEKGMGNVAGAAQMGVPESTFRSFLAQGAADKADILTQTADMLRRQVDEKKYVDVGVGVETQLGLSNERLKTSVAILKQEGYVVESIKVTQLGTGKETRIKVLAPPGETWGSIQKNVDQIRQIQEWSDDGGRNYVKVQPPMPINPKRVQVVTKEDGGDKADGMIYVRPNVADTSLGLSPYGQVRIQVGNEHFLKGMAVYKDDLPDGVDLQFHTSKSDTGNKLDAMKPLKTDTTGKVSEDLPFGSVVRQMTNDKGKVTSVMNLMGNKETSGIEGGWEAWSSTLSSQMLSKQKPTLAKKQLDIAYNRQKVEFEEIMKLTNPVVKQRMLEDFADGADSAAVHLKAASLPRQATKVILPINSLKDNEIYAPSFRDGETVVLVRYPHGGTFEIPELVVNKRNREGKKLLGDALDAVGINANVAQRLSGADFDGDTVIVIPNSTRAVKHSKPLESLKDFDPRSAYPAPPGMKQMSAKTKGVEMGKVSNLITDMTIRQAPHAEIVRAVRHSMAVIDAEKHPIDWKASARANGIKELTDKYQTPYRETGRAGASTLISRAGSEVRLPNRIPRPQRDGGPIDKKTGERVYVPTGKKYLSKKGETLSTEKHKLLAVTKDARDLSSGTVIEAVYAGHSNRLKDLANQARLESLKTPPVKVNATAKKTYAAQVASLDAKLAIAKRNAPRERQAQIVGNAVYKQQLQANPELEYSTKKKLKYQTLENARINTGAKKTQIVIEDDEWDAIQNGAISTNKLKEILTNADPDKVKALATPRTQRLMTSAKSTKARSLLAAGYTRQEVADRRGVSLSTLDLAMA